MTAKVSVCIPVYKVEPYIEKCARSLFEQTLDEIEYVFVDDCSPDHSIEVLQRVLKDYPHRQHGVKIIRHNKNQGVMSSRRDAINASTGEYVIHCDPDDYVELDAYRLLYDTAVANNADMVYCSFYYEELGGNQIEKAQHSVDTANDAIDALFYETHSPGLCNKMYRKEIVHSTSIIYNHDVSLQEDLCLNVQYLLRCKKICQTNSFFYHYQQHLNSICTSYFSAKGLNSMVCAACFLENILPVHVFDKSFNAHKRRILIASLIAQDGIPAGEWHRLWKSAKLEMLKISYPWKLKLIFFAACINYTLTSYLWRKWRESHHP